MKKSSIFIHSKPVLKTMNLDPKDKKGKELLSYYKDYMGIEDIEADNILSEETLNQDKPIDTELATQTAHTDEDEVMGKLCSGIR